MPHIVTQACCGDASCVFACPVNAIHPTPDEEDFGTADMLYIDPVSCVDCGACVSACPVGAITAEPKLAENQQAFVDINAIFHRDRGDYPPQAPVSPIVRNRAGDLRVAVVGSGPAALYAADELLKRDGTQVTVFDRLPTPHGLVRAGVAPDHHHTKTIERLFRQIEDQPGFSYRLNVEVGSEVTHQDLAEHHHAVIYATGASRDRALGIPGEDLAGSETATDFVAWYNGHPDHALDEFDLSGERAVIVGNGNVALDVARILSTEPADLATTDITDHAIKALTESNVREVILLGRRSAAEAAFTLPELIGLLALTHIDFVVEGDDLATEPTDAMAATKIAALREAVSRPKRVGARRIVFRFLTSPTALHGVAGVDHMEVVANTLVDDGDRTRAVPTSITSTIATRLVLRSIGYAGVPVAGVPFDASSAVIPNDGGRVTGLPGTYVVGWIKRGPTGFIGTNKTCSQETVDALFTDHNAGRLVAPAATASDFEDLIARRCPSAIDKAGWRRIDRAERQQGWSRGQPRQKFTALGDLVHASAPTKPARSRGIGRRRREATRVD